MAATWEITALWLAFAATHVGLSSQRLRPRLVGRIGEGPFLGLYSVLALAIFIPLVWCYFENKHAGPVLWAVALGPAARWALYLGMGAAFVLMLGGVVSPSPAQMGVKRTEARGVHLLTRHPLFMGLGLFGALHLVPNGFASDVAFFAGFPLFALLGCWHQDRRKLATSEEYRGFAARAPFLPFTGGETLRGLRELSPLAWGLGIGVTVVLRVFHVRLFAG